MQDFPERLTALEPFWGLWRLDAFIGEGSYGKVYRIKREEFGETYYAALKWISLPQNQSEIQSLRNEGYDDASIADHYASVIKAFQSEIVLMSKLRGHSHIVSFEDHLFGMGYPHSHGTAGIAARFFQKGACGQGCRYAGLRYM